MQTVYFFEKPVVQKYFKAAQPYDVYALKLGEGNIAKQLEFENKRLCLEWLENAEPRIPRSVARAVIGLERWVSPDFPYSWWIWQRPILALGMQFLFLPYADALLHLQ